MFDPARESSFWLDMFVSAQWSDELRHAGIIISTDKMRYKAVLLPGLVYEPLLNKYIETFVQPDSFSELERNFVSELEFPISQK